MKSIRWKLVMMYIALVFIVMISYGTFMIVSIRLQENDNAKSELESAANLIENTIIKQSTPDGFQKWFKDNTSPDTIVRNIISMDGTTIASSHPKTDNTNLQYRNSVVLSALNGKAEFAAMRKHQTADGTDQRWMEYAQPSFDEQNKVRYVIYVLKNATEIEKNITRTSQTIFVSALIALFATVIIGVMFADTLTVPIAVLTKKAKEFAEGNLVQEIPVSSADEIGQLTKTFNNMAKELSQTMTDMQNEKNKLEIVLFHMTDGILAYSADGRLIHYNNVCKDLLDIKDIDTLSFSQMLLQLGVDSLDMPDPQAFQEGSMHELTLFINQRYLNTTINPYLNKNSELEGIIVVLQDITKHMRLDNLRKEFVANVSHEIRTPLTTIKSYAETLLDGALDQPNIAMDFLKTINNEADRMTTLVEDLLELSRSDDNRMDLRLKRVNLIQLVRQNANQHKITANRQNKNVLFHSDLKKAYVTIDAERINQVLNNIISNALKYSGENAKVVVTVKELPDYFRVDVLDNGIGIPKEDLRRIFERFYRVDKARSRSMGGTGLGLSIAKEIVEAHGGKIMAQSDFGKGTMLSVLLPKKA